MDGRIAAGNKRPVQEAKVRVDGWTKERREAFLDRLAASCNVRMAVAAAGMNATSAYALRRRDPAFAALWKEALAVGYGRLEEAVLRHALEGLNDIVIDAEGEAILPEPGEGATGAPQPGSGAVTRPGAGAAGVGAESVQLALLVLNRHRATVEGKGPPLGTRKRATREETDAALRKKLDALASTLRAKA